MLVAAFIRIYIYIYWTGSEKMSYCVYLYQVIKCLRLNRYNFQTVGAIDFLFSTLHRTSFLFGAIDSGVLHQLHASVATSDTP